MGTQEVITETQIKQRLLDLEEQNRKLQQELLEERKNTNFTQTYPKGWERIRNLIQSNPGAARLYSVLSEHIDGNCGAVVAEPTILSGPAFRNNQNDKELGRFLGRKQMLSENSYCWEDLRICSRSRRSLEGV